jgi:hypothetical protein
MRAAVGMVARLAMAIGAIRGSLTEHAHMTRSGAVVLVRTTVPRGRGEKSSVAEQNCFSRTKIGEDDHAYRPPPVVKGKWMRMG